MIVKTIYKTLFKNVAQALEPPPPRLKLSDDGQQAFIAHCAIQIITKSGPHTYLTSGRSIRDFLLDKSFLKNYLITKIRESIKSNNLKQAQRINYRWLDAHFDDKNFQQVLKGFQFDKGVYHHRISWPQLRMSLASQNNYITLFPVSTTDLYYTRLNQCISANLSGNKGTGKTFCFFIYAYLSQFKIKYQVNQNDQSKKYLQNFIRPKFWKVTQICYINLRNQISYQLIYKQIVNQFQYLYPAHQVVQDYQIQIKRINDQNEKMQQTEKEEENDKIKGKELQQKKETEEEQQKVIDQTNVSQEQYKKKLLFLLQKLKNKAESKDIKLICVFDEANRIFRLLRQLHKIVSNQNMIQQLQWKGTKQFKDLNRYYQLLFNFSRNYFDAVFLNSSQQFELKQGLYQKGSYKMINSSIKLLGLLKTLDMFERSVTTKYSSFISKAPGKIQLYNIFWFELLRYVSRNQIIGQQIQIDYNRQRNLSVHRQCFQEQFGFYFPKLKEKNFDLKTLQKVIVDWNRQVKHLEIRQYFGQYISRKNFACFARQKNIFQQRYPSEQEKQTFRQNLRQMKKEIEQDRQNIIYQNMIQYVNKGISFQQNLLRVSYIREILRQASIYNKLPDKNSLNTLQFQYLQNLSIDSLEKTALVETLKIGFVQNNKVKFNMLPNDLIKIIKNVLQKDKLYCQIAITIKDILIKKKEKKLNQKVGEIFDRIMYPVFKQGGLKIHYYEYEMVENKQNPVSLSFYSKFNTFNVDKVYPFVGFIQLSSVNKGFLDNIIQIINKQQENNQWIGCFPVSKVEEKIDKVNNKFMSSQIITRTNLQLNYELIPLQNQTFFDHLFIKKTSSKRENVPAYEILMIDWTMGKPESKGQKLFKQKMYDILKLANIKGDINLKFLIVAPDFNVQKLTNSIKNSKIIPSQEYLQDIYFWTKKMDGSFEGKTYHWQYSMGVASFKDDIPFKAINPNANVQLIQDTLQQCYLQIKKTFG